MNRAISMNICNFTERIYKFVCFNESIQFKNEPSIAKGKKLIVLVIFEIYVFCILRALRSHLQRHSA